MIRLASREALVAVLTGQKVDIVAGHNFFIYFEVTIPESNLLQTFLYTYAAHTTPLQLFELITARFFTPPPKNIPPKERELYQTTVKLRNLC